MLGISLFPRKLKATKELIWDTDDGRIVVKINGNEMIVKKKGQDVRIFSRNGHLMTSRGGIMFH